MWRIEGRGSAVQEASGRGGEEEHGGLEEGKCLIDLHMYAFEVEVGGIEMVWKIEEISY